MLPATGNTRAAGDTVGDSLRDSVRDDELDNTAPPVPPTDLRAAGERLAAVDSEAGTTTGADDDTAARSRRLWWAGAAVAAVGLLAAWWPRDEAAPPVSSVPSARHVYFADVAGWYKQTPAEVAIASPYDLTLAALPAGLPMALGPWQGGERIHDPAVDQWFRDPPVSIERTYRRADGELIWLSAFGHEGRPSYHLFEHTPEICYPLGGWEVEHFAPAKLSFGDGPRPFTVNHGIATKPDGSRLVFVFFYLWDQPARNPERGVLSIRIAAPVRTSPEATLALLEDDFLARIFDGTLAWRRF